MRSLLIISIMVAMLPSPSWGRSQRLDPQTSHLDPRFVPLDQLSRSERFRLTPTIEASFHFHLDAGVDCTGTYISSHGHFLTARHCVNGCLIQHHAVERARAVDDSPVLGSLPNSGRRTFKMTVDEGYFEDSGLDCPGTISGEHSEIRLVLTGGRGWLTPAANLVQFSHDFPDEYKELLDQGYEHSGDFAILQNLDFRGGHCLSLAESSPPLGAELHAVSYPCMSRNGFISRGETALVTRGVKTAGFKQSEYYKERGPQIAFDVSTVERKETFFSSLDMEKCGSGTALVDNHFNIVGVATRVYKSSTEYERGSLEAVDVAEILREVLQKRAPDFKEITTCHILKSPADQGPGVRKASLGAN